MENQCQECGSHMDFSEMGWDDEDQMEYPKYRDALEAGYEAAGGGSYECPSCGQYDTVRDVMENQHDPRGALRWVQDHYAPNDGGGGDEAIAVARMPYAYDEAEKKQVWCCRSRQYAKLHAWSPIKRAIETAWKIEKHGYFTTRCRLWV